jgi:TRAP-type C4-dicarboxylate transport system permease large subunit
VAARPPIDRARLERSRALLVVEAVRRVLDRVLSVLCIVLFVALVAIVTGQVFTRLVLDDSAPWTEEAARYTFVVLALLAAALVFSERGHIAVEILANRLPRVAQKFVAVLVETTVAFFALYVLIIGGWRVSQNAWGQDISTLPASAGQVYLVLPVTGVLITLYSLYHIVVVLADVEEAAKTTGIIMLLIGVSGVLAWVLSYARIPQSVSEQLLGLTDNKWIILVIIMVILLVAGTVMDPTPAILIFTPIFLPIVTSLGISPIHFGTMMVFNMCLGNISPPIGNNLFVAARVGGVKIEPLMARLMPMFWALCIALIVVTFVPQLSTWLPTVLGLMSE